MGLVDQASRQTTLKTEKRELSFGVNSIFECLLKRQSKESGPAYRFYQPHLL